MVCEEGRIAELRAARISDAIDLEGNFLAPGFIDLHVHGAMGRDAMEGSAEAFRAICDFHASGGTTSPLLTTTTARISEILRVVQVVGSSRAELPQIAGVHVEGPFLSRERAGAQRAEFILDPTPEAVTELLEGGEMIRRMTLAPELPGALAAIERFRAAGMAVSGGHSDASDEEAARAFARGMRHTTHTFNCMSSMRRRGGERVAGLLEFALSEPEILCELIADGRHVSATLMRMLYRAKGAAGICLVTDATAGAGLAEGSKFSLGGRDCVVREGACWVADGSALAGSAARMVDLVRTMVQTVGVPLFEAVRMASANPARTLGWTDRGEVKVGMAADFAILSGGLEVVASYRAGERLWSLDTERRREPG